MSLIKKHPDFWVYNAAYEKCILLFISLFQMNSTKFSNGMSNGDGLPVLSFFQMELELIICFIIGVGKMAPDAVVEADVDG